MDTMHDLGGRQGFGSVDWQGDAGDHAFHEEWEARAWAIVVCFLVLQRKHYTSWSLDWFRHVIERMGPIAYLTRPYYDRWTQTMMALCIDEGIASTEEFVAGKSAGQIEARAPDASETLAVPDEPSEPAYRIGDRVRVKMSTGANHTRRPGYTRGKTGVVEAHHGVHPLADANAAGTPKGEHLYSVAFEASDLWPEAVGRKERVFVDLWESYLEGTG